MAYVYVLYVSTYPAVVPSTVHGLIDDGTGEKKEKGSENVARMKGKEKEGDGGGGENRLPAMEEGLVEVRETELGVRVGTSVNVDVARVDQDAELRGDGKELEVIGKHVGPEGEILEIRGGGAFNPDSGTGVDGGLDVLTLQRGRETQETQERRGMR